MQSKTNYWFGVLLVLMCMLFPIRSSASDYKIGTYYFPGWHSKSEYWNDLRGLPGSRSPGKAWPEREPMLGFNYPEESITTSEQHIGWASEYGLKFFVYDWYWNGNNTYYSHAIENFIKSKNKTKMNFCIMWANHSDIPKTLEQFDKMVDFWINDYFRDKQYLLIENKPVVVVFGVRQFEDNAKKLNLSVGELIRRANEKAKIYGFRGIYFIASAFAYSNMVNDSIKNNSYSAMTGYNYDNKEFNGDFGGKEKFATSYDDLIEGYKSQWEWILKNSYLPYFIPFSAGWNRRPWGSNTLHDNCESTPESFKKMLVAGKSKMDQYPEKTMRTGIIYAWNEFGEGGYIEPTKKWGFKYLQAVKDVFGK
jgi:hypothetical protein